MSLKFGNNYSRGHALEVTFSLVSSSREEQKSLKRASIVIGVIAALIFLLCVAMVAVTLHFTPVMNRFASKYIPSYLLYQLWKRNAF